MKTQKEKGITLIALVITIIILIILATVAINFAFGDNGLIKQAELARDMTANSTVEEEKMTSNLLEYMNSQFGSTVKDPDPTEPPIDKEETKVGYYADIDGDKTPDGIIYADLAVGKSGQWEDEDGEFEYSYEAITGTKDYYISKTDYEGPFGTKDVLTAIEGSEGKDRFFVMALTDFNVGVKYHWYYASLGQMDDYETTTSLDFGKGRSNTENMIERWNGSEYGPQNADNIEFNLDMWGVIQDEVKNGWFVPSKGEWAAFGDVLEITADKYLDYGLSREYWSSSQNYEMGAWKVDFRDEYLMSEHGSTNYVRLSTIF